MPKIKTLTLPVTHVLMQRETGQMPASKSIREMRSALYVAQTYAGRVFADLLRSARRLARLPGITARYILLLNERARARLDDEGRVRPFIH